MRSNRGLATLRQIRRKESRVATRARVDDLILRAGLVGWRSIYGIGRGIHLASFRRNERLGFIERRTVKNADSTYRIEYRTTALGAIGIMVSS